ncbi:uncharacterized protein E0L32_012412 [Thyridium curvatum]|uniref:Uncharacterized protein n=1 Tax=Thyridium curvatum TaxID=1093900 RepID=A0A507BAG7_9PEZI|nr:uncharacterized protein E0L32_012412 [Thyridium curvatum]TPX16603.1 hypothetical protein E0L32_012412 [Thyridium curvatum]
MPPFFPQLSQQVVRAGRNQDGPADDTDDRPRRHGGDSAALATAAAARIGPVAAAAAARRLVRAQARRVRVGEAQLPARGVGLRPGDHDGPHVAHRPRDLAPVVPAARRRGVGEQAPLGDLPGGDGWDGGVWVVVSEHASPGE